MGLASCSNRLKAKQKHLNSAKLSVESIIAGFSIFIEGSLVSLSKKQNFKLRYAIFSLSSFMFLSESCTLKPCQGVHFYLEFAMNILLSR